MQNTAKKMKNDTFLIVDDHPLFSSAAAEIILQLKYEATVKTCETLAEAKSYIEVNGDPALVLLDLNLPDSPANNSLEKHKEIFPNSPVVVLTGMDNDVWVHRTIDSGAIGFISKAQNPAEIIGSLRNILKQLDSKTPNLTIVKPSRMEQVDEVLSPRQCEVMDAIATGASNKEVARDLGMSPGTVKVHLREIFNRLGANNRTEAVAKYRTSHAGSAINIG